MQFILSHLEDHFMGKLGVSKGEHSSKISEHKFLFFEFADHIEELTINCSLVFFPLFSNCVNLFLGVEDVSLSMFWLLQLLSLEVFIIAEHCYRHCLLHWDPPHILAEGQLLPPKEKHRWGSDLLKKSPWHTPGEGGCHLLVPWRQHSQIHTLLV